MITNIEKNYFLNFFEQWGVNVSSFSNFEYTIFILVFIIAVIVVLQFVIKTLYKIYNVIF